MRFVTRLIEQPCTSGHVGCAGTGYKLFGNPTCRLIAVSPELKDGMEEMEVHDVTGLPHDPGVCGNVKMSCSELQVI